MSTDNGHSSNGTAGIPTRPLGSSGEQVSILGMGGGHVGRADNSDADVVRIIETAIDEGITFMDNAWDYNDGRSERLMGKAIEARRDDVFLMTKVCARDRLGALRNLEDSLRRLRTDHIDLWQFHEINYGNDPEWIFSAGGAAEAARVAIEQGKVRYVGFTGHKDPSFLLDMLGRDLPWATAQMPIGVMDASFRSFAGQLLPKLAERGIGAIGMKSLGGGGQFVTEAGLTPAECIRFSLSQQIATLVSGIDSLDVLKQNVDIVRGFQPMSEEEQAALIERTRFVATDGRFEWYKTTQRFDAPTHRSQHGFALD